MPQTNDIVVAQNHKTNNLNAQTNDIGISAPNDIGMPKTHDLEGQIIGNENGQPQGIAHHGNQIRNCLVGKDKWMVEPISINRLIYKPKKCLFSSKSF